MRAGSLGPAGMEGLLTPALPGLSAPQGRPEIPEHPGQRWQLCGVTRKCQGRAGVPVGGRVGRKAREALHASSGAEGRAEFWAEAQAQAGGRDSTGPSSG